MENLKFSVVEKFIITDKQCDWSLIKLGIQGNKMKLKIDPIRKLIIEGNKVEADALKKKLPAILFSGIFNGGRTPDKLEQYSKLICLDLDNLKHEEVVPIKDLISNSDYTFAVFVSPGGAGLKVLVKVNSGSNYHKDAYKQVSKYYTDLVQHKFDEKTCDINRLTFMSYDEDLYDYPDSKVFEVGTPLTTKIETKKINTNPQSNILGLLYNEALRFTELKEKYVPNNRNNFIHLLASNSNRLGIPIDYLLSKLDWCEKPKDEINSTVKSAYKRIQEFGTVKLLDHKLSTTEDMQEIQQSETVCTKQERPEYLIESPYFPEDIYNVLPNLLKQICDPFTDRRDKDLVLLSSLGVLSSLFPNVVGYFDGDEIGTNIYVFISAPAASGKGVINKTRNLGNAVQKILKEKYLIELNEFETSKNSDTNKNDFPLPKPVKQSLFIPANTSVSKIIEMLNTNADFGLIFETEGDTLANAFKNDWGDFSDTLRKAFHHENISMARRGNNEHIEIENPYLSVVLSGTPNQVANVIETVENGFFSRFFFYDFETAPIWKSQFLNDGIGLKKIFEDASEYLAEVWVNHENTNKTLIEFTNAEKQSVDEYFTNKLAELYEEYGSDITPSIKRACLICYRIAMILATLRALETNAILPEKIYIEKVDYDTALSLVDTGFVHLVRVFNRFKKVATTKKMNGQQEKVFKAIPDAYTTSLFDAIVASMGIPKKTGEKYLKDFKKLGLVKSIKHGYYEKVA